MQLRPCIAILALAWTSAFAGTAAAQSPVTTSYGPFSITSTSGTQLSNNLYSITTTTTGVLQVQYTASPGHCSDVRTHILVDGVVLGVTNFLSAGQASGFINVGPVAPGAHTVALQGEGRISGCNSGVLVGWGGTMQVTTSVAAVASAADIPGPGILATLLVFTIGAYLLGPWRRRRR